MQRQLTTLSLITLTVCLSHLASVAGQQPESRSRQSQTKGQQQRFAFQHSASRHDADKDGKIARDEFEGFPQFFKRCDRNGDGIITEAEFMNTEIGYALYVPDGAGHGGLQFSDTQRYGLVKAFVDHHIKQTKPKSAKETK